MTLILPIKFWVSWLFRSKEEVQNRFSRWRPLRSSWISNRKDFYLFLIYKRSDTSYQVSSQLALPFRSSNSFLRWWPWRPSWISDRNDFKCFRSTSCPDTSYQVSSVHKKFKIEFQESLISDPKDFSYFWSAIKSLWYFLSSFESTGLYVPGSKFNIDVHLGYPIGAIWAIFDLQVLILPKFQVNWPFGSAAEPENRFSRWPPSCISDRNNFSYFWVSSRHNTAYQISE